MTKSEYDNIVLSARFTDAEMTDELFDIVSKALIATDVLDDYDGEEYEEV